MKNYVVIGGSSGIGNAIVNRLAEQGGQVYASYHLNPQENKSQVKYFHFDVLEDQLNVDQFPDEIDGLVYCPGSISLKPFHRIKSEAFVQDFRLQVLGATEAIKSLLPKLKTTKKASIVLFSTVAVQTGFTFHTQVAISKGAIEGLTRSLAAEFAPSIRVNAIAPALTQTNLASKLLNTDEKLKYQSDKNPMKRVGDPKDIAEAAVYLLSEKSSWVTGQILHVDGGFSRLR